MDTTDANSQELVLTTDPSRLKNTVLADADRQELTQKVLGRFVELVVGSGKVAPRPGQVALTDDIASSSGRESYVIGEAPTGVGKSGAALANAAVSAHFGERTVISTEGLPLQAQIVDKDAPMMDQAARDVLGGGFSTAVLKGFSNYVCFSRTVDAAQQVLGGEFLGVRSMVDLRTGLEKMQPFVKVIVNGIETSVEEIRPLLLWALGQEDPDDTGDRATFTGVANDTLWRLVSVTPDECVGPKTCPFANFCKGLIAKERASEADVIVTNHSMLAVQASQGIPVVIGNPNLGEIDHVIVDEAHALAGIVRDQGQCEISGRRLATLGRIAAGFMNEHDPVFKAWRTAGVTLADRLDVELSGQMGKRDVEKIPTDADPLELTGDAIIDWVKQLAKIMKGPAQSATESGNIKLILAAKRAIAAADNVLAAISQIREHHTGVARWLELPRPTSFNAKGRNWVMAQSAPIQVGSMLSNSLWHVNVKDEDGEEIQIAPSVALISGTLPRNIAADCGLYGTKVRDYESPFDDAYDNSMLYVARAVDDEDVKAITGNTYGKPGFDTTRHVQWAAPQVIELVQANGGAALVLTATVAAGKLYVEKLRSVAAGRWQVFSQWDGIDKNVVKDRWKADPSSVLVGTKSFMTGVDAPGETCSLVIIDRVPRAASNPIDDERVALLVAQGMNRWKADREVYGDDARVFMEQAAGRLIRSISDGGMLAILDPRLLSIGKYSMGEETRNSYMKAFRRFRQKVSTKKKALKYLRQRERMAA